MDCEWTFFSVDLELTNMCGENCAMCPRHRLARPQGQMSPEVFSRVLAGLVRFGSRVTFSGFGNPTLHPSWNKCIHAVRSAGLPAGLVLHPSALTPEVMRRLQEHPPSHLEVSFPTTDPQLYATLCPHGDFHEAVKRVEQLRRLDIAPMVCIGLQMGRLSESAAEYHAFWKARGVRTRIFPCHSRGGNLKNQELLQAKPVVSPSCGLLAIHAFVAWNGDVLACCHDLSGQTLIGNLATDGPLTIARKKAACAVTPPWQLCRDCDEFRKAWPLPDSDCPTEPKERGRCLARITKGNQANGQ
jgi:hypothetical protein